MHRTPHAQTSLPDAHTRTLVVVDPAVEGWQGLVEDLECTTALLVLDAHAHGLQQLSDYLGALQTPLHSIHLIGHGRPGGMRLGSSVLDLANLQANAPQWQRIGHALEGEGALVLYGCELAKGPAGRQFVNALAGYLSVEVTASSRRVGAQALGGDWVFDHYTGKAAAAPVLQAAAMAGFGGVLDDALDPLDGLQTNQTGMASIYSVPATLDFGVVKFALYTYINGTYGGEVEVLGMKPIAATMTITDTAVSFYANVPIVGLVGAVLRADIAFSWLDTLEVEGTFTWNIQDRSLKAGVGGYLGPIKVANSELLITEDGTLSVTGSGGVSVRGLGSAVQVTETTTFKGSGVTMEASFVLAGLGHFSVEHAFDADISALIYNEMTSNIGEQAAWVVDAVAAGATDLLSAGRFSYTADHIDDAVHSVIDKVAAAFDRLFGESREHNQTIRADDQSQNIYPTAEERILLIDVGRWVLGGNGGNDIIFGYGGDDIMDGHQGNDAMDGGSGNDILYAGADNDTANGGDGNDRVEGHEGDDILYGGLGDDDLWGNYVNQAHGSGDPGNDQLHGGAGNDRLYGASGNDELWGDGGNDVLFGGDDNDVLHGGEGDDMLQGGSGNNNSLYGNAGNDWLVIAGHYGTMFGGTGDDTYEFGGVGEVIVELAGEGTDTVRSSIDLALVDHVENLVLTGYWEGKGQAPRIFVGGRNGTGNSLNNTITGNDVGNTLNGLDGSDTLYGLDGDDSLSGGAGNDVLDGGSGADTLSGGTGNDTYVVDSDGDTILVSGEQFAWFADPTDTHIDTVIASIDWTIEANWTLENLQLTGAAINATGNILDNVLTGNAGNNQLIGLQGNDMLDGGAGADRMSGGAGDDTYVIDSGGDVVVETADEGIDTVVSSVSYAMFNFLTGVRYNVEKLTLVGLDDLNGFGTDLDNVLIGNAGSNQLEGFAGNDTLDGGLGADTLIGGTGDDLYVVDNSGDVVTEANTPAGGHDIVRASVSVTLGTGVEELQLIGDAAIAGYGNGLGNQLDGNAADNLLDGGTGADQMRGNRGNDTYVVDDAGDWIEEAAEAGNDTVRSSVSRTLEANVENLELTGGAAISGSGNSLANRITGNGADNLLDGGAGADTLAGGWGDDTYIVDDTADRVLENANAGTDTVRSSVGRTLEANVENLIITGNATVSVDGNALDNRITGNGNNDHIEGGAGNDVIEGGDGDDTLFGESGDDTVSGGAGSDFIRGNDGNDTLLGGDGNDSLHGYAGQDRIEGGVGDDYLQGYEGDDTLAGDEGTDTLVGDAGQDLLDGGAGNDDLRGGGGDDVYMVDNDGDRIVEDTNAGLDTVRSSVSLTLGANVERLELSGSAYLGLGNDQANVIIGSAGSNDLYGYGGDDDLDGGGGVDRMFGGHGNDTFHLVDVGDSAGEASDQGIDTVLSQIAAYTLENHVENLQLIGPAAIGGTGNDLSNRITGNDLANNLDGGGGADTLIGGAGADTLTSGTGADHFTGTAAQLHQDRITDLGLDDTIDLIDTRFSALHYDRQTGVLSLDTGSNGGFATRIQLSTGLVGEFVATPGAAGAADSTQVRLMRDSDADGVGDFRDNARFVPNADQRDTDGDGFGNIVDADLNQDNFVDFFDLSVFESVFFTDDANADFNGDGMVDFFDLSILESLFFGAPGPGATGLPAPPLPDTAATTTSDLPDVTLDLIGVASPGQAMLAWQ